MLKSKFFHRLIVCLFLLGILLLVSCKIAQYRLIIFTESLIGEVRNEGVIVETLNDRKIPFEASVFYGKNKIEFHGIVCKEVKVKDRFLAAGPCYFNEYKDFYIHINKDNNICPPQVYSEYEINETCGQYYVKAYTTPLSSLSIWDSYELTVRKSAYLRNANAYRDLAMELRYLLVNPKGVVLIEKSKSWSIQYLLFNNWRVAFSGIENVSNQKIKEFIQSIRIEYIDLMYNPP
ncbi:hypothetical protein [Leptospira alexanderi]|uniref:hypothetical protein n=1 Tax=Leptospira alexanderi TaxID=100053 RepID=UPI001115A2B7|nr:hypothetical protein [Leptospira alexanderi]